jgi:hypothetical protein
MQVVHGLQQFTMIDHEPFTAGLLSKLAHTAWFVYPAVSPDLCVLTFSFFFFSLFMGLPTFFFFLSSHCQIVIPFSNCEERKN